jgi:hypothetical protein
MFDVDPNSSYVHWLPSDRSDKGEIRYLPANTSQKQIYNTAASLLSAHHFSIAARERAAEKAAAKARKEEARRARRAERATNDKLWKRKAPATSTVPSDARRLIAPVYTCAETGPNGQLVCREMMISALDMALAGIVVGPNYPYAEPPAPPLEDPQPDPPDVTSSSSSSDDEEEDESD